MINDIESEIDGIRDEIYNEIKTLSISERKNYFRKGAELIIEELGLRLIKNNNAAGDKIKVRTPITFLGDLEDHFYA